MPTATWKDTVIARASADEVEIGEGNIEGPVAFWRGVRVEG
jgi:hypothetical protein